MVTVSQKWDKRVGQWHDHVNSAAAFTDGWLRHKNAAKHLCLRGAPAAAWSSPT